jgi:hypothetical protein
VAELKNTRHEHFCQLRAIEGLSPWEAYQQIGGKGQKHQARKLMGRADIKARIAELLAEAKERRIDRAMYTKDTVIKGLLDNITSAQNGVKLFRGEVCYDDAGSPIQDVDHGAINTAWNLLGIEVGMFVKESKIRHLDDDSLDRLSLDELLQHTQRVLWETSDGQIDINLDDLRAVIATAAERDGADSASEDGTLQALRETVGLPHPGGEEA